MLLTLQKNVIMDNETLRYLEQRFDSMTAKQDKVNEQLFDKLNAIHEQTIRTNGRVNKHDEQLSKIDTIHINCAGKEALKKYVEQEASDKVKDTKQYQIGALLLNVSIVSGIVLGVMALIGKV